MAGYLDRYGEGHDQRAKRKRLIVGVALAIVLGGGGLYLGFKNYRQKSQVKQFVELLQKHDYAAAYKLWGCTDAKPCTEYPYNRFLGDWGPQSPNSQIAFFEITKSRACGSGVIVNVDFGQKHEERFWVEGSEMTIGFSPWSVCPPR
jgi:hypothetical protein